MPVRWRQYFCDRYIPVFGNEKNNKSGLGGVEIMTQNNGQDSAALYFTSAIPLSH